MKEDMDRTSSEVDGLFRTIRFGLLIVCIVFFWGYIYVDYHNEMSPVINDFKDASDVAGMLGTKGDYFGGLLNPFLAFFSLLALLYTIRQQSEELAMTRKELAKTASSSAKQAEAAEAQIVAVKQQQFDGTFSLLLTEHNKILTELQTDAAAHSSLNFKDWQYLDEAKGGLQTSDLANKYFRVLYQLLKYIAKNHPNNIGKDYSYQYLLGEPSEDEKGYASLVRSMIPSRVLMALAVNGYEGANVNDEYRGYFLLICRYAMLEHLDMSGALKSVWNEERSKLNKYSLEAQLAFVYPERAFGLNTSLGYVFRDLQSLLSDDSQGKLLRDTARSIAVKNCDSVLFQLFFAE